MATPQEIAAAWAQAYGAPAASTYQAPATTNYGNLAGGIGQDVLSRMKNTSMWDPSGGNGSQGVWGYEGGQPVYGSDANGNPNPVTYADSRLVWHPAGQGVGEQYPTFDPVTGEFKGYQTGSKVQSYASGIASVAGAGLGFGLVGAAAGGAGAAAAGGGAEAAGTGAGVSGFGDAGTMYAGGSAADAGTLGGGYSLAGGGTAAMGAGAAGAAGGGGGGAGAAGGAGAGVPPPANPYVASSGGLSSMFSGGSGGGFNWGSLVGPALSGISGIYGASQAGKAADAQIQAAKDAQAQFKPWVDNGAWAINQAGSMMGKNGPDAAKAAFTQDPGYQFRLDQGNQALTRAAAANGTLGSGKYLKDAMTYNQGQASQEYGNSYNRLMGLAGMGQTATGSSADYGTQGANAKAAGIVGGANAMTNALGQGYSMYSNNQMMNRLFPGY